MNKSTRLTLLTLPFALVAALIAGCGDLPTSERTNPLGAVDVELHNFHLVDRATVTPLAKKPSDRDANLEEDVNLLVGFSSPDVNAMKVVRRWKVVKRWKIVKRWKVVQRWERESRIPDLAITIPRSDLDTFLVAVQKDGDVGWVEPDVTVGIPSHSGDSTPASGQHVPWGIASTGAEISWAVSGDGADVEGPVDVDIYLLDTGASSADLNVVECLELTPRGLDPCRTSDDLNGHGTEVIGAAAAMDNDRGIVGVAPGARIHVVKILNEMGEAESSDIISVLGLLTERKLRDPETPMVVNMSFGLDAETTSHIALDEAVRLSSAMGVVYVVAAGNDGRDAATYSPAHVAEAITVGAYNERDQLSTFSNWGPVVDLLAPGEMVEALTATGDGLTYTSGTSVAAGWASGAAALYLAGTPTASPAQVREALVASARSGLTSRRGTTDRSVYVAD